MKLWLIRHTRADIAAGICYGRSDVSLPASFAADARPLLAAVGADRDAVVYSSPLRRCALLAQRIAAPVAAPVLDSRLQEMDFGAWEGRPWSEVDRAALDQWAADPLDWRVPGGETVRELATRAGAFLDHVKALPAPAACLVTHGGVLRMLCAHLWRQPLERALDLAIPCGSGLYVQWSAKSGHARLLAAPGWDERSLPQWMSR